MFELCHLLHPSVSLCLSLQIEVTYPDGSPADGVKVRVKAELTTKDNVYTSELMSKDGEATFEIPSIPTAAQYVWLEVSGCGRTTGRLVL